MKADLIPRSYKYAQIMYEELHKQSTIVPASELVQYGYPASEIGSVRIYTGFLFPLADKIGFTRPQQNTSMNTLKAMQALTMIKHGAPFSPAVYILNYHPTDEKLLEFKETNQNLGMKVAPRKDELYTRDIAELRMRVQKLETQVEELLKSGRHDI